MSVSGYKYYLVIIDDFSHYVWCFPLKHKSDTSMHLKHFHAYVQTQFPHKLKSIQCDHGREFDNNELRSFFSSNGVVFRFSCPHTSQQNGKAERMIRTITNTVRTLLFHSHLPPCFWVAALHTAVYLLNITPTTTLALRTPHQALFHQIPNYTHLRIFGCLCFPNLTATTAHKLEPWTRPCVFLGYALQHRGYRCLDLESRKYNPRSHLRRFREPTPPFPIRPDGFPPINCPTILAPRTTLLSGGQAYTPLTYLLSPGKIAGQSPSPPTTPPARSTTPTFHPSSAYHGDP
ncbi:hypothetical protein V2J09_017687 [Rumex salicifolius]